MSEAQQAAKGAKIGETTPIVTVKAVVPSTFAQKPLGGMDYVDRPALVSQGRIAPATKVTVGGTPIPTPKPITPAPALGSEARQFAAGQGSSPSRIIALNARLDAISKANQLENQYTALKTQVGSTITNQQDIINLAKTKNYNPRDMQKAVANLDTLKSQQGKLDDWHKTNKKNLDLYNKQITLIGEGAGGAEYVKHPIENMKYSVTINGKTTVFDSYDDAQNFIIKSQPSPDLRTKMIEAQQEPYLEEIASEQKREQNPIFQAVQYGSTLGKQAEEAKLAGDALTAGALYAIGAGVRFGTGFITGPATLVSTIDQVLKGNITGEDLLKSAESDPLVLALNLATLGFSVASAIKGSKLLTGLKSNLSEMLKTGDFEEPIVFPEKMSVADTLASVKKYPVNMSTEDLLKMYEEPTEPLSVKDLIKAWKNTESDIADFNPTEPSLGYPKGAVNPDLVPVMKVGDKGVYFSTEEAPLGHENIDFESMASAIDEAGRKLNKIGLAETGAETSELSPTEAVKTFKVSGQYGRNPLDYTAFEGEPRVSPLIGKVESPPVDIGELAGQDIRSLFGEPPLHEVLPEKLYEYNIEGIARIDDMATVIEKSEPALKDVSKMDLVETQRVLDAEVPWLDVDNQALRDSLESLAKSIDAQDQADFAEMQYEIEQAKKMSGPTTKSEGTENAPVEAEQVLEKTTQAPPPETAKQYPSTNRGAIPNPYYNTPSEAYNYVPVELTDNTLLFDRLRAMGVSTGSAIAIDSAISMGNMSALSSSSLTKSQRKEIQSLIPISLQPTLSVLGIKNISAQIPTQIPMVENISIQNESQVVDEIQDQITAQVSQLDITEPVEPEPVPEPEPTPPQIIIGLPKSIPDGTARKAEKPLEEAAYFYVTLLFKNGLRERLKPKAKSFHGALSTAIRSKKRSGNPVGATIDRRRYF